MSDSEKVDSREIDRTERVVAFREYPKVVFLWPIGAVAVVITLLAVVWPSLVLVAAPDTAALTESGIVKDINAYVGETGKIVKPFWGNLFFLLFFLNILVLAYDFDMAKGLAVFLGGVALLFGLLYFGALPWLSTEFRRINITFNLHFMWATALMAVVTGGAIWAHANFNWWELTHNELIHRKRFLGDIKRYPAQQCRLSKEIPDILEYVFFFGCGRLVFQIPGEPRAFVLEHVPFVDRRERQIKEKLGSMSIRHESPDYDPHS